MVRTSFLEQVGVALSGSYRCARDTGPTRLDGGTRNRLRAAGQDKQCGDQGGRTDQDMRLISIRNRLAGQFFGDVARQRNSYWLKLTDHSMKSSGKNWIPTSHSESPKLGSLPMAMKPRDPSMLMSRHSR